MTPETRAIVVAVLAFITGSVLLIVIALALGPDDDTDDDPELWEFMDEWDE
jgi:hypothetical protein